MVRKGYLDFWREMMKEVYPQALIEVINAGVPGDTAGGGRRRLRRDVLAYDPHCIFIQFALNDAYHGDSPDTFAENITAMIEEIKGHSSADTVLLTSVYLHNPREDAFVRPYYERLEQIATTCKLPLASVHEVWRQWIEDGGDFHRLVQYDRVHPTEEGYHLMAEALMKLFLLKEF